MGKNNKNQSDGSDGGQKGFKKVVEGYFDWISLGIGRINKWTAQKIEDRQADRQTETRDLYFRILGIMKHQKT